MHKHLFTKLPLLACLSTGACAGASQSTVDTPKVAEVSAVPQGFHTATSVLVVGDIDKAVAYYEKIFAAKARNRMPGPDGKPMHAELAIGDSVIMLSAENHSQGVKSPATLGGTNGGLMVYVSDVDAVVKAALKSGSKKKSPIADMFWGDRFGEIIDPFGHSWAVTTHKEDVSEADIDKRGQEFGAAMAQGKKPPTYPAGPAAKSFQPGGMLTVTPSLVLAGGAEALSFYEKVMGAKVRMQMPGPNKSLMHAEIVIGDSVIMLASESPKRDPGKRAAKNLSGSPFQVHLYVEDVDALFASAEEAGGKVIMPPQDMFWGDYWGLLADPSGNQWGVGRHKENLTPEQITERMKKQMGAK